MTRNDPRLDLCATHNREILAIFQPRKHAGGRPKGVPETKAVANARKRKLAALWGDREKRVLRLITKEPHPIKDFLKKAGMNKHVLSATLRRLKAQGKVKREGWSYGARWSLA